MFSAFNEGGIPSGMWGAAVSSSGRKFKQFFRAYPVAMMPNPREDLNYGGKIVLPPSALNKLTMLHITYPMLFEMKSEETELRTFSGVLEFIAEEGRAYLPQWMMGTLSIQPGALLEIQSTDLPSGSFLKIQPQSVDFLDITDPKAVLENALRNFSALTIDDIFEISYNDKIYGIKVLEVKPESEMTSICVVETDISVDFAPPVGYVEPSRTPSAVSSLRDAPAGTMRNTIGYDDLTKQAQAAKQSNVFSTGGQKLSGKSVVKTEPDHEKDVELGVDAPPLRLPFGKLFFGFKVVPVKHAEEENEREQQDSTSNVHFQGGGQSLRESRKRKSSSKQQANRPSPKSPDVIEID